MVNGADFPYYSDPVLGCQVVGLPYKDHNATMYLVLPNEPGYRALKRLRYRLTVNHLQGLADCTTERTVIITLPRMKLESTIYLKEALKVLGIQTLFDPFQADLSQISDHRNVDSFIISDHLGDKNISQEQSTDVEDITSITHQYPENTTVNMNMSTDETPKKSENPTDSEKQKAIKHTQFRFSNNDPNISNNPGLYADNVIHKVTVDVTEVGTEAAAASIVSITRDGSHKVVKFERPFLFFIRHEATGSVLFWGTVVKPTPNRTVPSVK
jgi:serine protease inhibitor